MILENKVFEELIKFILRNVINFYKKIEEKVYLIWMV